MKVIVREEAVDDIEQIFAWIAKDDPKAATATIRRLRERIGRLGTPGLELMGRTGIAGTRELVEAPYIIVYNIVWNRREIEIIAVFHGRRDR
jgi:plasmid stabilization system protein ParE